MNASVSVKDSVGHTEINSGEELVYAIKSPSAVLR